MKTQIALLKDAASKIGSDSLIDELNRLERQIESSETPIMIPLVGEFSSGKTSLINALTDSKALETATKPTTATIFEIHFGAPSCNAEILRNNGTTEEVSEISDLKNEHLTDATVVTVFDTSKKVSPYTILVDTPGISSPDPKHQQVLMDFLPQADALLLVIDINQQLTKSLAEFLKSAGLSGIEINVVLTKSDTKATAEIAAAKKYFVENCGFTMNEIVTVSAAKGELSELYKLLNEIATRKSEVLHKSVAHRLKTISEQILTTIKTLLNASPDTATLEAEISSQKLNLQKNKRRIQSMIDSISGELEELTRDSCRKFEDNVSSRLNGLINGKSQNYDADAISAINSISSVIIGDYRQKIMHILAEHANRSDQDEDISISAVAGIDLSGIGIQGLSYNLNLNTMGHEYDKWIKGGVIAIAAVGGVVAMSKSGVLKKDNVMDFADTATDVGSMISNGVMRGRLESAVKYGSQVGKQYDAISNVNNIGYGDSGVGKGMIDKIIGSITEKTLSKPQRARAIRVYIDETLAPEFKTQLDNAAFNIKETVMHTLFEAANNTTNELTNQLKNLEEEMRNNKSVAEARKAELMEVQTKLLTFYTV